MFIAYQFYINININFIPKHSFSKFSFGNNKGIKQKKN